MVNIICIRCNKSKKVSPYLKNIQKYCSYECVWKNRKGVSFTNRGSFKKGHKFIAGGEKGWIKKGAKLSEETKQKIREKIKKGKENPFYKQTGAHYSTLHKWVVQQRGRPNKCEQCGIKNLKDRKGRRMIHWANIDHKYRRVKSEYISLCHKCHNNYDIKYNGKYEK